MDIASLLDQYGLLFVAFGCMIEGDAVAVSAGVLAHQGVLPYTATIVAAGLGGWTSDMGLFTVARSSRHHPRTRRVLDGPRATEFAAKYLKRPVALAVAFRFVPGTRTLAPVALGAGSRIAFPIYAAITFVTCQLWALIAVTLGKDISLFLGKLRAEMPVWLQILFAAGLALFVVTWSMRRIVRRVRRARTARR
ncbi:VTT domain-containing protein [Maribius pontilimi]|uniref:VTT domain-containing protein n=1 Tax=Palleronia pontilimi TaxID=1964209 RepID=A0A934MFW0_9RHOB|nr:VTT domain-containing protein [Palleronia pontilimi]MBJ3761824.1 VTT domain-containing protein [Palleronia pontilimi]